MKFSFIFVCQAGELEIKALLLAASLRDHLACNYELIAAVPQPPEIWGQCQPETLDQLRQWNVKIAPIENHVDTAYPIGNKLSCLLLPCDGDKQVFLDSDILCVRPFEYDPLFAVPFNAKPADIPTCGTDIGLWRHLYALADLPCPDTRVLATVTQDLMMPYFNAGVIGVHADQLLGRTWLECTRLIHGDANFQNEMFGVNKIYLDQLGLALAVAKLGLNVGCLSEAYNFPGHLKVIADGFLPIFYHYHGPQVLRREPLIRETVIHYAERYPILASRIAAIPSWAKILEYRKYLVPRGEAQPRHPQSTPVSDSVLIITGIPRSGTSFLCAALNQVEDVVAINEPQEILSILQKAPWHPALYHGDLRRTILDGEAVKNRMVGGRHIEDTAQINQQEDWLPKVRRRDFTLATKNTLVYLARLREIRKGMPRAQIVACVRHPFQTISSWKRTFSHLRNADVTTVPVGGIKDSVLPYPYRLRLEQIEQTEMAEVRRALYWRHLAEIVLEFQDDIMILRYEDFIAAPVSRIVDMFSLLGRKVAWRDSADILIRQAAFPPELSPSEAQVIWAICGPIAERLGYQWDET